MAERAVLYARGGVSFRPRSAPARDRRIDGVSRRWREMALHHFTPSTRRVACRAPRDGAAAPRGGEEHTHPERIKQDARRP